MKNTSLALSDEQKQYKDAVDSALEIILYYEDDEYECLADESVITELTENHSYSIADAHAILAAATAIHQYRSLTGFYN